MASRKIPRNCLICGKLFKPANERTETEGRFCSRRCFGASQVVPLIPKECEYCGNPFMARSCMVKIGKGRWCSKSCSTKARYLPLAEEFARCVESVPSDRGCILWKGQISPAGYGVIRRKLAHRVAFELAGNTIPNGYGVCHTCDNPPCVNPAHLFPGTQLDNMQDAVSKDRQVRGERNGNAKLTDEGVREARRRRQRGEMLDSIASDYGVSPSRMSAIVRGLAWKHVN